MHNDRIAVRPFRINAIVGDSSIIDGVIFDASTGINCGNIIGFFHREQQTDEKCTIHAFLEIVIAANADCPLPTYNLFY
jgi:hypothetical protein